MNSSIAMVSQLIVDTLSLFGTIVIIIGIAIGIVVVVGSRYEAVWHPS